MNDFLSACISGSYTILLLLLVAIILGVIIGLISHHLEGGK